MCLALPARIISINQSTDTAMVALGEVNVEVSLALVDDVHTGDFVLIHVGYALNKISQDEAEETLKLFAEAGLADEQES